MFKSYKVYYYDGSQTGGRVEAHVGVSRAAAFSAARRTEAVAIKHGVNRRVWVVETHTLPKSQWRKPKPKRKRAVATRAD